MFNATHGLFADTWTAWLELIMTIVITLVGGYFWGIAGILLNKVVTTTLIGLLWKPYYLFHSGLHLSYSTYWKGASRNFIVSIISFVAAHTIFSMFSITPSNYLELLYFGFIGVVIYLAINLTLIYLFCKGANDFYLRTISIFHFKK
jgi:hypothetical protein